MGFKAKSVAHKSETLNQFLTRMCKNGRDIWFKNRMLPYEKAAFNLKLWIHDYLVKMQKNEECGRLIMEGYITGYDTRSKSFQSVYEKIYDGHLQENEIFSKLDDLAGGRVVVTYLDQIGYVIKDMIIRYLVKQKRCVLSDSKGIKDYIEKAKESGYRSKHVYFYMPVTVNKQMKKVLMELQIRTDIEDSWSNISHRLLYKNRKFNQLNKEKREYVQSEMTRISDLLFVVDGMMLNAKNETCKIAK